METFSISLEWGENDEGLYHWAGQAKDYDDAVRLACEEMDRSHNENYAMDDAGKIDPDFGRGLEIGEETTDYQVSDYSIGVNEYAAAQMLEALRQARTFIANGPCPHELEILKTVEAAIAAAEGRARI